MSVIHLTKENFDQEVLQAKEPVLIDFFANWCGPCKMVAPIIEEIAAETTDKKICKVNIDEQPALAEQFGVMSIPTLVVVKEGRGVNKSVGAKSKKAILEFLNG